MIILLSIAFKNIKIVRDGDDSQIELAMVELPICFESFPKVRSIPTSIALSPWLGAVDS